MPFVHSLDRYINNPYSKIDSPKIGQLVYALWDVICKHPNASPFDVETFGGHGIVLEERISGKVKILVKGKIQYVGNSIYEPDAIHWFEK